MVSFDRVDQGDGADDENLHELAEQFLLAVRGGEYPSFDYIRQALDIAEALSDSIGADNGS